MVGLTCHTFFSPSLSLFLNLSLSGATRRHGRGGLAGWSSPGGGAGAKRSAETEIRALSGWREVVGGSGVKAEHARATGRRPCGRLLGRGAPTHGRGDKSAHAREARRREARRRRGELGARGGEARRRRRRRGAACEAWRRRRRSARREQRWSGGGRVGRRRTEGRTPPLSPFKASSRRPHSTPPPPAGRAAAFQPSSRPCPPPPPRSAAAAQVSLRAPLFSTFRSPTRRRVSPATPAHHRPAIPRERVGWKRERERKGERGERS